MKSFAPRNYFDTPIDALVATPQADDTECSMDFCHDRATRTGFCEGCLAVVGMLLKYELGSLDNLVAASVRDLQYQMAVNHLIGTLEQCHEIKCYMIAEFRNLSKLKRDERELLTHDFLRTGVRDEPANRERRAELFGGLPRVKVPDEPVGFSVNEALALDRLRREKLRIESPDGAPELPTQPCKEPETQFSIVLLGVVLTVLVLAALAVTAFGHR